MSVAHPLAIWQGDENYELFQFYLAGLLKDLELLQTTGIEIQAEKNDVALYLTGDWKFLAIVLGLTHVSSAEGFCLWLGK